jgi:(1->4)-alpha-D-glucan 1-alpha-D-glucosylmutase
VPRHHDMPFGAMPVDHGVRFRLWAPAQSRVSLVLEGASAATEPAMARTHEGWFELTSREARAGSRYRFRLGTGETVPDPAARFQAGDVHGASEVIDPRAYRWSDDAWRGRPWEEAVIYELHVGTFTPAGTFRAAREKLDHLSALGVTAIELMPVADFPGTRNWGYDGVLPFAPDARYGRPEDLKALVEAAQARGMMVLLDVVYNHFGPEGNYLHLYAPQFFTSRHHTPWGAAVNFDDAGSRTVRDFFIHNALFWLTEYRFDGLRLDAVHAIVDDSTPDILRELAQAVADGPGRERHVHLVLENDRNEARYLGRDRAGRAQAYVAQWNDDIHHALHVLVTGETDGYYEDYADSSLRHLGRALTEGFCYQGEPSRHRGGAPRGEPSTHLPPTAFVSFLQTHDQVGNRAFGERLSRLAPPEAVRAATAILLLSPQPPLLFMGQERGAVSVFLRLRARPRGGGDGRAPARVRALPGVPRPGHARAHSRSERSCDVRFRGARLEPARSCRASRVARAAPRAAGAARGRDRAASGWTGGRCRLSYVRCTRDRSALAARRRQSAHADREPRRNGGVTGADTRRRAAFHDRAAIRRRAGAVERVLVSGDRAMTAPRIPRATYRLQLNRDFTFAQAAELVPYLARLGVSHVYCSPYLKARAGSTHGYDIVDHNTLNPEIGSSEDYERFVAALSAHNMGQMLDIVPNHMGVGGDDNPWWLDVLENGQASDFAQFFDIDWLAAKPELRGKVLIPLLEDHYGKVLERGLLRIEFDAGRGELSVRYHGHRFPLDPKTYSRVLAAAPEALASQDAAVVAFRGLAGLFDGLPSRHDAGPERRAQRNHDKETFKQRLAQLHAGSPAIRALVEEALRRLNGAADDPASFDALHALLEEQAYRLTYWRVAADEINYRRFFDVDTLAALRMERPDVFAATHRLVLDLVSTGKVQALRVDHPDGLYDPAGYFRALREAVAAHGGKGDPGMYLIAEKVLIPPEPLPEHWPVDGTTGYDFVSLVSRLLVYPESEELFTELYERVAGPRPRFADLLYENKKLVMRTLMSGELMVLASLLDRISEADRRTRDYTLHALRDALMDVIACFPVYRTYVSGPDVAEQDRRFVNQAVADARRRSPAVDVSVFDFLRSVLLLENLGDRPAALREEAVDFVRKLQQYTAPVMAKGLEDTSFYGYNRFVALNEVGNDPRRFRLSVQEFHRANSQRGQRWPHSLLSTSTHDTKRSGDVRARLFVLSEMPAEWRRQVLRWVRYNRDHKRDVAGDPAPDGDDEYLLYQTLLGAWPLESMDAAAGEVFRARIEAYMLKAVREAKRHTSWISPNQEYEGALTDFVRALLTSGRRNRFLADFVPFARRVARFGLLNSLSQTLLKLASPGVPDFYQGTELWDFSLVDPDNRRPVDYARRREMLDQLDTLEANSGPELAGRVRLLLENPEDGRAKLHLIRRALRLRREQEDLFRDGSYEAVSVAGERAVHVCAFLRRRGDDAVLAAAGRWFTRLNNAENAVPLGQPAWNGTWIELPQGSPWRAAENMLTGEQIDTVVRNEAHVFAAPAVFARWPAALLRLR